MKHKTDEYGSDEVNRVLRAYGSSSDGPRDEDVPILIDLLDDANDVHRVLAANILAEAGVSAAIPDLLT
jgi:hypothetical protein